MPIFEFYVPNMVCPACVAPVNALKACQKVKSAVTNYVDHIITIETEELGSSTSDYIKQLTDAIDEVGFPCEGFIEVTPSTDEQDESYDIKRADFEAKKRMRTKKIIRSHWAKGLIGASSGLGFMLLCMFGMNIPMLVIYILSGISTVLTLYFGKETYKNAYTSFVKTKTFSMDSLFAVSTLLSLGISCIGLFIPGLPMLFDTALMILGFKNIGKAIEESIKQQLSKKSFRSYAPRMIVSEIAPGIVKTIPVKNLWPGNDILVYKGQTVPVDGVCLSKNATIYNTIVTGRTIPQQITENQTLCAGCVVPDDIEYIKIRVTDKENNSYLALLDQRTKAAELDKSSIENVAAKGLKYFVPTVFAIATISVIFVSFFINPVSAIHSAISILVSACPCTLGLITPLAMKAGLAKGADHGVIYKSGKSIEAASDIDTLVFDLNGTLTTGVPTVTKSTVPVDMLALVAKMETDVTHPIARAICQFAAAKKNNNNEFKLINIDRSHHAGVAANIDSKEYVIGNSRMMEAKGIKFDEYDAEITQQNPEHVIYFAKNKKVVGYILLEDPLRVDAIATIHELQINQGKNIHICTGADYATAVKYADQLGIPPENVSANCLGESKVASDYTKTTYIRDLIRQGHKVAMIGDAGNDATAVAASHFGVAIKSMHGNTVTQDKADAIINQDSLWSIVNAFTIAKQTMRNIKQNLWVSIGYNLTSMIIFSGLLLAIGFAINPALGAVLMFAQTLFILMNVERFKCQNVPSIADATYHQPRTTNKLEWQSTNHTLNKKLYEEKPPLSEQPQFSSYPVHSGPLFKDKQTKSKDEETHLNLCLDTQSYRCKRKWC